MIYYDIDNKNIVEYNRQGTICSGWRYLVCYMWLKEMVDMLTLIL